MTPQLRQVLDNIFGTVILWLLAIFVILVLIYGFRFFILPRLKGKLGEASINFWAKRLLDQSVYYLIPNVILPTPDGTTQIDHVIVSRYGIFVVETKNYKGWIYGDEQEAQWTQMIYKRKERFQNPLRQNYKHTKTLAELTGIPDDLFKSMVVFVGDCKFKTDMPANVAYVRDFVRYIKGFQTPVFKYEQVPEIVATIQAWANTVTGKQKAQHAQNLQANHEPVSTDAQPPACPRCGSKMTLRTSRKNDSQFWGCPKYPNCRGTRQV